MSLRGGLNLGGTKIQAVVVDDDRLDLRAAEVDAAAHAHVRTITPSHVSYSAGSSPP